MVENSDFLLFEIHIIIISQTLYRCGFSLQCVPLTSLRGAKGEIASSLSHLKRHK